MRYLIYFSYDGTNFWGLASQPKKRTVQEELEKVLKYINNDNNTKIVISGRTDKGVHALKQIGHVDINVSITEDKLKRAMNSLLPEDIYVLKTKIVNSNFHARYMVKEKIYQYKLNMGEYDPILRNYIYQFNKKLNIAKIKEGSKYLVGIHDFKSFTPNKDKKNNYIREIKKIEIDVINDVLIFTFRGTGFIKYQIRNMIGLLIQIGLEKKEPIEVLHILENKNRSQGFRTAHPEGLYLIDVIYE